MLYYHGYSALTGDAAAYRAVGTLGTLLASEPARDRRLPVFVQNQSAADIVVVMYAADGVTICGQVILTGTGATAQGGEWCSVNGTFNFIGKIEVYGASGAALSVTAA